MALSTRRLCMLLLVLLTVAATFSHGYGAVLQDDSHLPGRRAGPPMAGPYLASGSTHVPHDYFGIKTSYGPNLGDFSASGRGSGRVWSVGSVVGPVLAAAWFA